MLRAQYGNGAIVLSAIGLTTDVGLPVHAAYSEQSCCKFAAIARGIGQWDRTILVMVVVVVLVLAIAT